MMTVNTTGHRQKALVILPFPLTDISRKLGCVEKLTLGNSRFEVIIPPNMRIGQRIRLRGLAHHVDPELSSEDLYLLIQESKFVTYEFKRDVHIELPLSRSLFIEGHIKRDTLEVINIGGTRFEVKIPMGFTIGKRIRLPGMAKYGNGGHGGDVYILPTVAHRPTSRWWGVFDGFSKPTQTKINVKFSIPGIFEVAGEWVYKKLPVEVTTDNS